MTSQISAEVSAPYARCRCWAKKRRVSSTSKSLCTLCTALGDGPLAAQQPPAEDGHRSHVRRRRAQGLAPGLPEAQARAAPHGPGPRRAEGEETKTRRPSGAPVDAAAAGARARGPGRGAGDAGNGRAHRFQCRGAVGRRGHGHHHCGRFRRGRRGRGRSRGFVTRGPRATSEKTRRRGPGRGGHARSRSTKSGPPRCAIGQEAAPRGPETRREPPFQGRRPRRSSSAIGWRRREARRRGAAHPIQSRGFFTLRTGGFGAL